MPIIVAKEREVGGEVQRGAVCAPVRVDVVGEAERVEGESLRGLREEEAYSRDDTLGGEGSDQHHLRAASADLRHRLGGATSQRLADRHHVLDVATNQAQVFESIKLRKPVSKTPRVVEREVAPADSSEE